MILKRTILYNAGQTQSYNALSTVISTGCNSVSHSVHHNSHINFGSGNDVRPIIKPRKIIRKKLIRATRASRGKFSATSLSEIEDHISTLEEETKTLDFQLEDTE